MGKNILILDELEANAFTYKFILENIGHKTTTTIKNKDILPFLDKEKYDLLIYDIPHVPYSDGEFVQEYIEELKKIHEKHPRIPIVAISTELNITSKDRQLEGLGIAKGFHKPIERKKLIEAVERYSL